MTPRHPTIDDVMQEVCDFYSVTPQAMKAKGRTKHIARARGVFMYLAHTCAACSLNTIGQYLNDRDHTTVLFAEKRIAGLRLNDPELDLILRTLTERLTREPETLAGVRLI